MQETEPGVIANEVDWLITGAQTVTGEVEGEAVAVAVAVAVGVPVAVAVAVTVADGVAVAVAVAVAVGVGDMVEAGWTSKEPISMRLL